MVGTPVTRRPPHRPGRAVFSQSGSSVGLASARIFTVARYKIQLLFPAVRLARVIQPYMSGTSFLCGLRPSVRSFPVHVSMTHACGWLSQPLSTMPDKTPQWHVATSRRPTWFKLPGAQWGFPSSTAHLFLHATALMTPANLHILAITDASVLPSAHVKTLGVRQLAFRSCTSTSGIAVSPAAYRILCLRLAHLVRHLFSIDRSSGVRLSAIGTGFPGRSSFPANTSASSTYNDQKASPPWTQGSIRVGG